MSEPDQVDNFNVTNAMDHEESINECVDSQRITDEVLSNHCETNSNDTTFMDSQLNSLMYPVIPKSTITAKDHLLAVMSLASKFKFTYEATLSILRWINCASVGQILPTNKPALEKVLLQDNSIFTKHFYCEICNIYLGKDEVIDECYSELCKQEKLVKFFLQISLKSQIQQLMALPQIASSLKYRFSRSKKNHENIEDIYDSPSYLKHCEPGGFLYNSWNCTLTFNTDGASCSNSSNTSVYPVFLQINELPPHLRIKHMLLSTIWVGKGHPDMNLLLDPVITELNELYETGITWSSDGVNSNTSKFAVLICSVDSVARPMILNMKQFNGEYGCTFCYASGRRLAKKMVYPFERIIEHRNNDDLISQGLRAFESQAPYLGVKGPTNLTLLPLFDCIDGMVVEPLHNVFLGVTRQYALLLFAGDPKAPYYIGKPCHLRRINQRLISLKPPNRISRRPRSIYSIKQWKASEWRNWLLYYCLPCLENILKPKYMKHLAKLCQAIYIYNSDSISFSQLQEAQTLLQDFVSDFEVLFGIENMSFNVHLLRHIPTTVENWGPLWCYNASVFESWNNKIVSEITSPNGREIQIASRFMTKKYIENVCYDDTVNTITQTFIKNIFERRKVFDDTDRNHNFKGLGAKKRRKSKKLEYNALKKFGYKIKILTEFKKASINKIDFRSIQQVKSHSHSKLSVFSKTKFNNTGVFNKNIGFGVIRGIVEFEYNDEIIRGIFIEKLKCIRAMYNTSYIFNVNLSEKIEFVNCNEFFYPVVLILTIYGLRATKLSNCWEID